MLSFPISIIMIKNIVLAMAIISVNADEVRVGIIGSGWGVDVLLPAFKQNGFDVTAIYSRSKEKAEAIARANNVKHAFDEIQQLVCSEDVDLVSVVVPTHLRHEYVMEAIRCGKHVLADKPFALNAAEALEMKEAAKNTLHPAGKVAFVDFETRLTPGVQQMRKVIQSGSIGKARVLEFRASISFGFAKDEANWSHWSSKELGGGVFSAVGTHFVDVCRFLLDDDVEKVMAIEDSLVENQKDNENGNLKRVTSDFYSSVQMVMKKGTHVSMILNARPQGSPNENTVAITCEKGSMKFDFMKSKYQFYTLEGQSHDDEMCENPGNAFSDVGTPYLCKAIRSRILYGDKETNEELRLLARDIATFEDGYENQKVTDAVHSSASKDGEWVYV